MGKLTVKILSSKDAGSFRNRPVIVKYHGNDVILTLDDTTNSFPELLAERKKSLGASDLERALDDGCRLANVGVSGTFVVQFDGKYYFMAISADRVDRKNPDTVVKLLSAYVPAELMHDPEAHLKKEIAEEFLPTLDDGKLLVGMSQGEELEKPFAAVLSYSGTHPFYINQGNHFQLPGMKKRKIRIVNGEEEFILPEHAEFHAAADTNSGQLIFKYNILLPNYSGLSLHRTEDKLNQRTGMLDVHLHQNGILLFELDKCMRLTGNIYIMNKGKLLPYKREGPIMLTEAFAPKVNGISSQGSIGLTDYLQIQSEENK